MHRHPSRTRRTTLAAAVAAALSVLAPLATGTASDTDLFRTNVAPNVLLIVDNSKSMTNAVWHSDFGKENAPGNWTNPPANDSVKWRDQTDCTYFRDRFEVLGYGRNGKLSFFPGGRRVNLEDPTGFRVRSRSNNNYKPWEPPILDEFGDPLWNDANANGIKDFGEWDAHYKTCNPESADYTNTCLAIKDYDGDGIGGQTVRDAFGQVVTYTKADSTVVPLIYRYDPDNSLGSNIGTGATVKIRTTIHPRVLALATGIDTNTYTMSHTNLCGVDTSGWTLFTGESNATTPSGKTLQIDAPYLDFLMSSYGAAARDAVFQPTTANGGTRAKSSCLTLAAGEPPNYETYRRTRLMALRLILRTVTCELKEDVRFGLMQFRFHGKPGDDNGGYVAVPVENLRNPDGTKKEYTLHDQYASHEDHLARVISRVGPDSQTPLAESLFQAYTYFMSRDPSELPPARDYTGAVVSGVSFPVYEYNMDLHNPDFEDGGDLNMTGGHYVGSDVVTTHPKPSLPLALDADQLPLNNIGLPLGITADFPTWDPNAAPDPVQFACQKNFVLLITDGFSSGDMFDDQDARVNSAFQPPNPIETATDRGFSDFTSLIGDHYRNPDGTPDETETTGGSGTNYLDDIANFMSKYDFRPDLDGDQTIDVYTVGYSVEGDGTSNVERAANHGNGLYFESADADELAQDIIQALTDIIEKSQSFTSATVPASRTTDGNNFYSSYFRPRDDSPYWDGHLKNFKFTSNGDILTKDDKCAVGDTSADPPCVTAGVLQTSAEGVWDAAEEVPDPIDRQLFTGAGGTQIDTQAAPWFTVSAGVVTHTMTRTTLALPVHPQAIGDEPILSDPPYSLPDPWTTTDLDNLTPVLVSNLSGCQYGTLLGTDCALRVNEDGDRSILGDIFHSNPMVVGSPNAPINGAAYKSFSTANRTRKRVIYAGANDGWLHGFLAGVWQTTDGGSPPQPLVPPRHDRGSGAELFGFMPGEIRENAWRLPGSQPGGTVREFTTVDGSPIAADVWFYRGVDSMSGRLTGLLNPPVSTAKIEKQWRTVLVGGLRDGGSSYYALDVTNPDSASYPGYLWEFPCNDCSNAVNPPTSSAALWMGKSWSEPVITRVRVAVDNNPAIDGHDRWVAIFGGGYDPCGDPNSLAYYQTAGGEACDAADINKTSRSRAIFMVDITTGQLLAAKVFAASDTFDQTGQVGYDELQYGFASAPAVFDLDFDGYADVVYIGDLGGNIWKWVVSAVGDDPINNSSGDHSLGQPDWPLRKFFHAEHSDGVNPPTSSTHFQSFFFPVTGVLKQGDLVLAWGAGERAAPEVGALDNDDSNNNHFYVVKDADPYAASVSATTLLESDLLDVESLEGSTGVAATCSDIGNAPGYFLTGRDTEKFITNSVIFLGDVITGSFIPAPPGSDQCSASGSAFVYRFNLSCGTGDYTSNPGGPGDQRRKAIGGGLPTRPRVSVGDLNQGGTSGGCNNKVVVITSDGQIDNDCPGPLPSSGVNIRTWRER